MGAFWLFFGFLATLNIFSPDWLYKIFQIIRTVAQPFVHTFRKLFGSNYVYAMYSSVSLIIWALLFYLAKRRADKENIKEYKLSYFQEIHLRTTTVFYVLSYVAAGFSFNFLNRIFLPEQYGYYMADEKIIPYFTMLGFVFYLYIAYRLKDHIAQLFGIYFMAMCVGCFSFYTHACYWLGVPLPVLQLLMAIILVLIGVIHVLKSEGGELSLSFWTKFSVDRIAPGIFGFMDYVDMGMELGKRIILGYFGCGDMVWKYSFYNLVARVHVLWGEIG